jgi:Ca-activated chloride channel homolog
MRGWKLIVAIVVSYVVLLALVLFVVFEANGAAFAAARWQNKWWLIFAVIVPPLAVFAMTVGNESFVPTLGMSTIAPLWVGPRGVRTYIRWVPAVLRGVALALAFLALARPENVVKPAESSEQGIDIVLVLDLSGSMRAVMDQAADQPPVASKNGQKPTRLDTAKDVILDFISRRKTDRIGVVVFGKNAYVLSPPTLDYGLLTTLVGKMDLELIDGNGTAIGDAVGTGVARLRRSNARSKAIILLTDGDSNAGAVSPDYATHLAQTQGVRVYTVQIGNGDDVDVQDGVDLFGQPHYVRAHFPVNPQLLQTMATKSGGESFVATDKGALEKSMHTILDRLEKTKIQAQAASFEELFPWFVAPAVMLLLLEALVRVLVLRRFP